MLLRQTASTVLFASALVVNCGTDGGATFQDQDGSNGSSGANNESEATDGSGRYGFGSSGEPGTSSGSVGDGGVEICDGIDNDGNGIIDDVDVGNDGICDCLRIATLGKTGTWGSGDVFATWLNERSTLGADKLGSDVLTRELLDKYQVIVAENLSENGRSYSDEEVEALRDWVKAGGGFLTLIGYSDSSERTNVNALLSSFGMSYKSTQILSKQGGSTVPITEWIDHPVTKGVSKVGVDNGYEPTGKGTILATKNDLTLLKAQEVSEGHVLMWGDEWITYDSEWSDHQDYQVELFWLNMIKWLTPAKECQVPIPPSIK